jgi:hypothetical protein
LSGPARFLFDECLSGPSVEELRGLIPDCPEFDHIPRKFRQGELDSEWVPSIAREGRWIVITADAGRKPSKGGKLPALCRDCKVTHILLSASIHALSTAEKQAIILSAWSQIARLGEAPAGARYKLRFRPAKGSGILRVVLEPVPDD